jgi:hypothetical protein
MEHLGEQENKRKSNRIEEMARQYENILSVEDIEYLSTLPEVLEAKEKLVNENKIYFSVDIPLAIKDKLTSMGLDVMDLEEIPMRWIKGDTPSHTDSEGRGGSFENTYLVYLTDSVGEFQVGDAIYPITQGTGYVFEEGVRHETVNTGTEPRLLIGPMNESGNAVGAPGISAPGGTIVYIRQSGNDEQLSYDLENWSTFSWPLEIRNTSPGDGMVEIHFTTDLKVQTAGYDFFDIKSEGIQIGSKQLKTDGTRPKIIVEIGAPLTYDGFIRNGDSGNAGYNNIEVYNLEVTVTGGATLSTGSGWLGQAYYANGTTGNLIVNCSSDGPIGAAGGGITGAYTAMGGSLTIRGCSSTGAITASGGGIVGQVSAMGAGSSLDIERCWTSGSIGGNCGGMCGNSCGINGGQLIIRNSYSTGIISGSGGGIFGITAGSAGIAYAINCYSTGAIGSGAGGIFGPNAGATFGGSAGLAEALNCYSTGAINSGGGIYGSGYTTVPANRCYSTGAKSGSGGGIWHNSASDTLQGANNYSESNNGTSGWNDVNATATLTGEPSTSLYGTTWNQPLGANTPYRLTNSAYSPYSLSLVDVMTATVEAGNQTDPGVIEGYGYTILDINGELASEYPTIQLEDASGYQFYGQIKTTTATPAGVYILRIYGTKNPYGVTTYTLTVTAAPEPEPQGEPTCSERVLELKGLDYETRNNILAGNTLICETTIRQPMTSYSDYYKMKMAYASKR